MVMNEDDMGCCGFPGDPDGKTDGFSQKVSALAIFPSPPSPCVASA
jgi:hypothetical protein